jgi:hypothetical protein
MLYVTTAHVSLRLGYSIKSGFENTAKIRKQINSIKNDYEDITDFEEEEESEG